jgi:hypothetical protein
MAIALGIEIPHLQKGSQAQGEHELRKVKGISAPSGWRYSRHSGHRRVCRGQNIQCLRNLGGLPSMTLWAVYLSSSGLTFYGGLISGHTGTYGIMHAKSTLTFRHLCDAAAPALILAYGIGTIRLPSQWRRRLGHIQFGLHDGHHGSR